MPDRNTDFVSIIVLAPGLSLRFGRNKLLEPVGERTMIEYVVSECLTSRAKQVVVVCGNDAEKVRDALKDCPCEIVLDEDFAKGLSYSVKKGLSRVNASADAVMVLPGDALVVDRKTINAMIREYSTCYAPIVTAGRHADFAHPILYDKNLLGELGSISEERDGLKGLLTKYRSKRRLIKTAEESLLQLEGRLGLRSRD